MVLPPPAPRCIEGVAVGSSLVEWACDEKEAAVASVFCRAHNCFLSAAPPQVACGNLGYPEDAYSGSVTASSTRAVACDLLST